jgi:hypothetical protein
MSDLWAGQATANRTLQGRPFSNDMKITAKPKPSKANLPDQWINCCQLQLASLSTS